MVQSVKECLRSVAALRPSAAAQALNYSERFVSAALHVYKLLPAHFISVWTGFSQQPRRTRRLLSVSRMLLTLKLDPLFICQQQQQQQQWRVKSWPKQKHRARKSARVQLLPGALRTYSSTTRSSSAESHCREGNLSDILQKSAVSCPAGLSILPGGFYFILITFIRNLEVWSVLTGSE